MDAGCWRTCSCLVNYKYALVGRPMIRRLFNWQFGHVGRYLNYGLDVVANPKVLISFNFDFWKLRNLIERPQTAVETTAFVLARTLKTQLPVLLGHALVNAINEDNESDCRKSNSHESFLLASNKNK